MQSTSSLLSLPSSLWPGVVAPYKVQSVGQIEYFDIQTEGKQMTYKIELLEIELFDHLTVCKQMTDVKTFCWYTQLKDQTVLFQTIQFGISQQS